VNKKLTSSWPMYAAIALALLAVLVTVRSCGDIAEERRQIENRRAQWQALEELQAGERSRQEAIAGALAGLPEDAPNLAELLRTHLPGLQPDLQARENAEVDGRILERYDLRLDDVEASVLAGFLEACAAARPPLRVVSMAVSPSRRGASDRLQAQLELIALR
jgi:hypothetical protein